MKSNITDIDYGLPDLLKLRPVSFTWTAAPQQGTQLGFIAQDVQPIFPQIVNVGDDTNHTLGLTYTEFIPIIVRAVQQLAQKLTDLTNTVAGFADIVTTKELIFTRASGHEIDAHRVVADEFCTKKSDGTNVCVTGDQFAAAVSGTTQTNIGSGASGVASGSASADSEPPVIQINGENPAHIHVGDSYSDLGARIVAPEADKNLGIKTYLNGVHVSNIVLDTTSVATDTIEYVAADSANNTSASTRTVLIEAAELGAPSEPTATPTTEASSTP